MPLLETIKVDHAMNENVRKNIMKLLGIYQITAGLWGLYVFLEGFIQSDILVKVLSFFFMLPLVILNLYAGYWLFKEKRTAPTLVNQGLQIFSINLWGKFFQYLAGTNFLIPLWQKNIGDYMVQFKAFTFSTFICFTCDVEYAFFAINIVPVILIVVMCYIIKVKRRSEAETINHDA